MREWWANVYPGIAGWDKLGIGSDSRAVCAEIRKTDARYVVHVRLKPEGAPRRYASEANRKIWETDPRFCRDVVKMGVLPESLSHA